MKILLLGAAGYIGTNLAIRLAMDNTNEITLIDESKEYSLISTRRKLDRSDL